MNLPIDNCWNSNSRWRPHSRHYQRPGSPYGRSGFYTRAERPIRRAVRVEGWDARHTN